MAQPVKGVSSEAPFLMLSLPTQRGSGGQPILHAVAKDDMSSAAPPPLESDSCFVEFWVGVGCFFKTLFCFLFDCCFSKEEASPGVLESVPPMAPQPALPVVLQVPSLALAPVSRAPQRVPQVELFSSGNGDNGRPSHPVPHVNSRPSPPQFSDASPPGRVLLVQPSSKPFLAQRVHVVLSQEIPLSKGGTTRLGAIIEAEREGPAKAPSPPRGRHNSPEMLSKIMGGAGSAFRAKQSEPVRPAAALVKQSEKGLTDPDTVRAEMRRYIETVTGKIKAAPLATGWLGRLALGIGLFPKEVQVVAVEEALLQALLMIHIEPGLSIQEQAVIQYLKKVVEVFNKGFNGMKVEERINGRFKELGWNDYAHDYPGLAQYINGLQ